MGCGLAGLAAVVLLWSAWTAWSVSRDLADARESAAVMRAALIRADPEQARAAMADFEEATEAAEDRTSGLTWSVFEAVPFLGDDAEGIATISHVLASIGRDALPPIADSADLVSAESFQPVDGVFPVDQIEGVVGPAERSERAFDQAAEDLAKVDSSHFIGPIRGQFDKLQELVTESRATLGSTYRAARLIPRMMGTDRPRYYLMVLQNNAELRSGGGLPGALSLVRMSEGKVDIVEQADMSELGRNRAPVVELTEEENRIFGRILGLAPVDATLTPDFVRSADIIRARWEREIGGRLDGMFFIDPVAVSYLLRGTGPVDVPGYRPIHTGNVVWAVENEIYRLTEERGVHTDYQQAVAKAVFNAFSAGRGDTAESIRGLVQGVMEGRIRMHSFEDDAQAEIAGTKIAGEFSDRSSHRPEVGIYINDGGPTKMQYYLTYEASVFARACVESRQELAGSIEFHSNTPPGVADLSPAITGKGYPGQRVKPGDQLLVVYLTSPVGGEIEKLSIDGQVVRNPVIETLAGRSLARIGVTLAPQARHRVEYVMRSGPDQEGDVELSVTPGAFPSSSNGEVRSSCDVR